MEFQVDSVGSMPKLERVMAEMNSRPEFDAMMLLICDGNGFSPNALNDLIRSSSRPVFGGIFPALIHHHTCLQRGFIVAGISGPVEIIHLPGLSDDAADYENMLDCRLSSTRLSAPTGLTFVDGYSRRTSSFLESLFTIFGMAPHYIGGGVGSISGSRRPALITPDGLAADSALVAFLPYSGGIGISHGWTSLEGPFRVTEADGNLIRRLDGEPAFSVYSRALERHSGNKITPDRFFETAAAYPFGIAQLSGERTVRDVIKFLPDGSLVCVGQVPEGAFLDVLQGDAESLIQSASLARIRSREHAETVAGGGKGPGGLDLVMDCISRALFLMDRFPEELRAIHEPSRPLIGACTIGEIAGSGSSILEFLNKTTVVGHLAPVS